MDKLSEPVLPSEVAVTILKQRSQQLFRLSQWADGLIFYSHGLTGLILTRHLHKATDPKPTSTSADGSGTW